MAVEQTLSIIKPDAVEKNVIGKIYSRFEEDGLRIAAAKMKQLSKEEAEGFYTIHKECQFFNDLVRFMISGPVMIQVLEKNNQILLAQNKQPQATVVQYQRDYDNLKQQLQELIRHRFGSTSERYIDESNPQTHPFDGQSVQSDNLVDTEEDNITTITSDQPRKGRKKLNPDLPRKIVTIAVFNEQRQCACGQEKHLLRYETSERYGFTPAKFEVIEERREVLACRKGCDKPVIAVKPLHILPKSMASEELLAHIVISKLVDRQPLYHLVHQFTRRFGVDISRKTLINWFNHLGPEAQPLINLLKDELLAYNVAALDPTKLQVLKEPGRLPTTHSYAYCVKGGPPDKPITLFEYNAENHKAFVNHWFLHYQGYIHADADNVLDDLKAMPDITVVNCNAHARRKFEAITKVTQNEGIATTVLRYYRKLYHIERSAKKQSLSYEQRYQLRLAQSQPILSELKIYLTEKQPLVLPQSPLGKAIAYFLKTDNNLTEQENKAFAILRKNFLFCDTVIGANALCNLFSLVRTAIRNGLDPYQYLVHVFKQLPYCQTVEDYEALLPWNYLTRHNEYANTV